MVEYEVLPGGIRVAVNPSHRFSQDPLLLARFVLRLRCSGRLLDLGTGCGIVALALIDAGYKSDITALDIDEDAIALLRHSLIANRLDAIQPVAADLRRYCSPEKFDLITCNPPYFAVGTGRVAGSVRHEILCTLSDVAGAAQRNLKQGGSLFICHKPERLAEIFSVLRTHRLEPKNLQFIRSERSRQPWLFLAEARLDAGIGLRVLPDDTHPASAEDSLAEEHNAG